MPAHPTYPGVYIEEIPSGVHTVSGVATSIAAFVGSFRKGPLNAPLQLFSQADFQREYGGLDSTSETTYAVQQFFLNGGQQAWVVRVADTTDTTKPARAATFPVPKAGGGVAFNVTAGRLVLGQSASDAGIWGNDLRVEIDYDTADSTSLFNLTVSEVQIDGDRTTVLQTETYRNLTLLPNAPNNAVEVINDGSRLIQLSGAAASGLPTSNGTLSGALTLPPTIPGSGTAFNVNVGTGNIACSLTYTGTISTYAQLRPVLESAIRAAANDASVPDGLKPLLSGAGVDLIGSGANSAYFVQLGRAARPFVPETTIKFSGGASTTLKLSGATAANAQQYRALKPAELGQDGPDLAAGVAIRPLPGDLLIGTPAPPKTGLFALDSVDIFNILCIPEATTPKSGGPAATRTTYTAAELYVEARRAMVIVDIPDTVTRLDLMQTWMMDNDSLRHPNAVVYFPRTNIADPLNLSRPRSLPSSGTVAGLWARTDSQRGVWKAPAGTEAQLRNVASLEYLMTDPENGTLNPLGVNCLRNFPVYSNICWGARTLEGADVLASDWKYLPVRRTTLFLEESLYRGSKWVVFQPNDEPLWAEIRLSIGAFMQDLFRQGAFQGSTPQQAYFVKCDGETTTQQDINNGIVNIEVGFAPLKPAEFVIIKIRQIAPGTGV
jgi:phage tail sheath protein FI